MARIKDNNVYTAEYTTAYVTSTSIDTVKFSDTIISYAKAHILWEKKSGGGGIVFTTTIIPTGSITGVIEAIDAEDGKVPVIIEDTTVAIANGGTGQSSLAGIKNAFGIDALSEQIATMQQTITYTATKGSNLHSDSNLWPRGYGKIVVIPYYLVTTAAIAKNDVLATFDFPSNIAVNCFDGNYLNLRSGTKTLIADKAIPNGTSIAGTIVGILS